MTFLPGQRVRARASSVPGHTRLPAYARGRTGTVHALRGEFPLSDEVVASGRVVPEALYSVVFPAAELWGAGDHLVYMDLFESYLRPADD